MADKATPLVVFGASGHLGRTLCSYGQGQGYSIIRVSTKPKGADQKVHVQWDPLSSRSMKTTLEAIQSLLEDNISAGLTVIVVCGGNPHPLGLEHTSAKHLTEAFELNVISVFAALQLVRLLAVRPASVVAVGSIWGVRARASNLSYITAKHALSGLVRGAAEDLRPHGIAVNALCPGPIRGEPLTTVLTKHNPISPDAAVRRLEEQRGLQRLLSYEDVAAAALMLAQSGFRGVRGQLLSQDD